MFRRTYHFHVALIGSTANLKRPAEFSGTVESWFFTPAAKAYDRLVTSVASVANITEDLVVVRRFARCDR